MIVLGIFYVLAIGRGVMRGMDYMIRQADGGTTGVEGYPYKVPALRLTNVTSMGLGW